MFSFPPCRILLPVDFSAASSRAYRAARLVALRFGARVEAVYCDAPLPPELLYPGSIPTAGPRRRRIESRLRRLYPKADAWHVVRGDPEFVLRLMIRRRRPDLLVMGTSGRRGLDRAVLGSVTEQVLHRSTVPVLVVRRTLRLPRRVLAPVRDDRDAQAGLLAAALVANAFGGCLDALSVNEGAGNPRRYVADRLAALPKDLVKSVTPAIEVREGNAVREILRAARRRDLLVLVARPKSILGDWLLGTTAERVARCSPIPVLAIPAGKRPRGAVLF